MCPLLLYVRLEAKAKRFTHNFQLRLCDFCILVFALALRGGFCSLGDVSRKSRLGLGAKTYVTHDCGLKICTGVTEIL